MMYNKYLSELFINIAILFICYLLSILNLFLRFDVGEIVRQHSCSVDKDETADELKKKLSDMGGRLLIDSFKELTRSLRYAVPQPEKGITYGKI